MAEKNRTFDGKRYIYVGKFDRAGRDKVVRNIKKSGGLARSVKKKVRVNGSTYTRYYVYERPSYLR